MCSRIFFAALFGLLICLRAIGSPVLSSPERGSFRIVAGGAEIRVNVDSELAPLVPEIKTWVEGTAQTLVAFYGRFPVSELVVHVAERSGDAVNSGTEYDGRRIEIHLDAAATATDLREDWMLTHEMFHLGFPEVARRYHYLEEGLSDYLEPLARARLGKIGEQAVWEGFFQGMPQGIPAPSTGGLDGARDWGRVYWGGCLFWLLVDLDIRQRSGNTHTLDDAIRAIVSAGGTGGNKWQLGKIIEVGDRATGTGSLRRLHDALGARWTDPDLESLWRSLGVRKDQRGRVVLDDNAPLVALRRSMTKRVP